MRAGGIFEIREGNGHFQWRILILPDENFGSPGYSILRFEEETESNFFPSCVPPLWDVDFVMDGGQVLVWWAICIRGIHQQLNTFHHVYLLLVGLVVSGQPETKLVEKVFDSNANHTIRHDCFELVLIECVS